ncbi:MAG TPA: hypothetical protein VF368_09505, partial [Gemmatimonadaceae bacterium]
MFLLAACAPLAVLGAQATPPRPDSARADSIKRAVADSTKRAAVDTTKRPAADTTKRAPAAGDSSRVPTPRPPRDTIKTPIARPYTPRSTEIGASGWHW